MYADDTVLLSETKAGIQELLNGYSDYCNKNRLNINIEKTKIVIFSKNHRKPIIYINNQKIEVVNQFKYLGITISKSGKFLSALKDNINRARRAFYAQMRQVKANHIPLSCHIDLFQKQLTRYCSMARRFRATKSVIF